MTTDHAPTSIAQIFGDHHELDLGDRVAPAPAVNTREAAGGGCPL